MTFHIAQQVTMIRPHSFSLMLPDEVQPVFGEVYTIRDISSHPRVIGLIFREIRNPSGRYLSPSGECSFNSEFFRPVIKNKTDIGFAHEILRKASRTKESAA